MTKGERSRRFPSALSAPSMHEFMRHFLSLLVGLLSFLFVLQKSEILVFNPTVFQGKSENNHRTKLV